MNNSYRWEEFLNYWEQIKKGIWAFNHFTQDGNEKVNEFIQCIDNKINELKKGVKK